MNRNQVIILISSIVLIVVIVLGMVFGCSTCSQAAERRRGAARLEAERMAADEAARLEAERMAADEAARLEAERMAADEAARLEAERLAAEARRRAAGGGQTQQPAQRSTQSYSSTESSDTNPFVGVWANANQAIVFRFRANGNVEVLNYTLVDEMVEKYWRTNRALTGGGFYDTRNPEDFESTYTGAGTYTVTKDTVSIKLNMKNHLGTPKTFNHATKFTMNDQKNSLRLTSGLPRKFIINKNSRELVDTKDFVTTFTKQ
jgi:hypothetical protein